MKVRCDYCNKVLEIKSMDDIQTHLDVCENYQEMMKIVKADIEKHK
jgi:phage FluMu protein Com